MSSPVSGTGTIGELTPKFKHQRVEHMPPEWCVWDSLHWALVPERPFQMSDFLFMVIEICSGRGAKKLIQSKKIVQSESC
jgi:hypothetical protein